MTTRRALLVDDDPAIRLTLSALLEDEGWTVACAASLAEARLALDDVRDARLVMLDSRLPDGEGTSLVPELRAVLPEAAIVVLSGAAPAIDATVERVLAKAGDPWLLLRAIEEAVDARAGRAR